MRKITFDEEELFAIAVFEPGSREETTARMSGVLEALAEDPDMHALVVSASEKLKRITDREFEELEVEGYREELTWEEENEEEDDPEAAPDSEDPGEEKQAGDDASEKKRGGDSTSDERRGDDSAHGISHATSRNATGTASEPENDSTQNAVSVTSRDAAGIAPEPKNNNAREKDIAGGST